jgi:hypothetical protein
MFLGLFGLIFLCMGIAFGAIIPAAARYSWPGLTHLLFVAVGLSVLGFCIAAAIRNLTYYTTVAHGTLEWGRLDRGSISGTVQLSDVQQMCYVEGIEAGYHINVILKSGELVIIDGTYLNGGSEAKRLLSTVHENFKDIEIHQYGTVA